MFKRIKDFWKKITSRPNGNYGNPEDRIWIDKDGNVSLNTEHPDFKKEMRYHIEQVKKIKVKSDA